MANNRRLAQVGSFVGDTSSDKISFQANTGIGTTNPTSRLTIDGDTLVTGVITATNFSGELNTTGIITATTFSGNISGVAATFTGNVTIGGTLTYEDVTNIDAIGLITARNGLQVLSGITTISGMTELGNVVISGIATATTFSGQINAGVGTITTLSGTTGTITNVNSTNLSGTIGTITTLESTNGTITNLSSTNLSGTIGTVTTLTSTNGTVTNLNSTNLSGTIGTVTTLTSTNGTVTNLSGTIGTVTTLNSTNSILTNINSSGISTLSTAIIGSGVTINNGGIDVTGVVTATSFVKSGGISSQFLKADGSVDSSTYLQNVVEDTTPQLGGNLDINGKYITGTGGANITGVVTATTFSGSGANLTNIPNGALTNSTVSYGGVSLSLGGSDASPAFNLADATGLPVSTGISGLGANVATFLATPSSSNLAAAVTGETGSGSLVFATSPTLVTPVLGQASATSLSASGIVTATGGFNLGISSAGTSITSGNPVTTLNFIGAGNTFAFNGTTVDISIAGGGGGGGVSEVETTVSTTSATGVGSFAVATYRSADVIAQISQGSNYQVGRYLMIHNGTTVTVVEESSIATGSMLGSFDGVVNGSNAELRVTLVSAGTAATVTTKIDTVTIP